MNVAETSGSLPQAPSRAPGKGVAVALAVALIVCVAIGAMLSANLSRGTADSRLRHELAITSELEALLTLHIAANTDFLKGVGTAGYTSRGWPIKRAAVVVGIYDRLAHDFAGASRNERTIRQLRQLSAVWPEQLDAAARNIALADAGAKLEPALMQRANETLSSIMSLLTALRSGQREQIKEWARQYPDIVVSVNVSPVQFMRADLPAMMADTLAHAGVSPRNIELEITEGVLMAPRSLATLRALREMGLSVAIDDFGSGYSSLGYIRSFMPDRLKLDMSFVKGIGHSRADEVIVKAVLALGHTLGMRVVAEGVETLRQLEFLIENGCNEAQGYWFARPVDAASAQSYLEASHAASVHQR